MTSSNKGLSNEVEERIKRKVEEIEEEMGSTHKETLNWVLNEILVLEIEDQIVVKLNCRYLNRPYSS